jgi:hypothetical protein
VRSVALACALLLLGQPALLRAQEAPPQQGPEKLPVQVVVPEPVVELPPRHTEPLPPPQRERQRRWDLIVGGVGVLTGVWLADRLLGQDIPVYDVQLQWVSWFPIAGPWFLIDQQRKLQQSDAGTLVGLSLDGLAQIAGLTTAVVGLFLYKQRQVQRLRSR